MPTSWQQPPWNQGHRSRDDGRVGLGETALGNTRSVQLHSWDSPLPPPVRQFGPEADSAAGVSQGWPTRAPPHWCEGSGVFRHSVASMISNHP